MSDIQAPAGRESGSESATVAQLGEAVRDAQIMVSDLAARTARLQEWTERLPRRHVPGREEVRVTELTVKDVPDPTAVVDHVRALQGLLRQAEHELAGALTAAADQMGLFALTAEDAPAGNQGPSSQDHSAGESRIAVTARLGSRFGDEETFEQQRQSVRRALEFDGTRTWRGRLDTSLNEDLPRWRALVDAAEAGADVQLDGGHGNPGGAGSAGGGRAGLP